MQNQNPDYYFDENGLLVMTEHFLKKRGFCCGNGCRHCPYNYENVPAPKREQLLKKRADESGNQKPQQ
jgi:hypothetical protein